MKTLAYFEDWSRHPGQTVRMAVSSERHQLQATFVQILSGPGHPAAPRTRTREMNDVLNRVVTCRTQQTPMGSHAELPLAQTITAPLTVHLFIWPTIPEAEGPQVVLAIGGNSQRVRIEITCGRIRLVGPRGGIESLVAIHSKTWFSVAATLQADGSGRLDVRRVSGLSPGTGQPPVSGHVGTPSGDVIRLATVDVDEVGSPVHAYNGKVGDLSVWGTELSEDALAGLHAGTRPHAQAVGHWDFSLKPQSLSVVDATGTNPDGRLIGGAERGVTGHRWTGVSDDFRAVPAEYNAVQFHDDDMLDAQWEFDIEFTLPGDLPSGLYGVRLSSADFEDCYPLFVPAPQGESADALLLFSTNTYLAYANDRLAAMGEVLSRIMPHEVVMTDDERYLHQHDELGRSCYDTHSDGTPVRYSSRRRPIINVRPGYPSWLTESFRHFAADTYLFEWIAKSGLSFHIATDEEVETEGVALLRRYRTVVTSSHPEYWTAAGLNAVEGYLTTGGRIMYLGGNGFYWVTSSDPTRPWIIEIRRDNSGTRCWNAPPGERTHVYGHMPGGLWRWRGRGPNTLLGVGFAAEGWNRARPFHRQPASFEGPCSVWFQGIESDTIGQHGYILGAAAGDEVDRFDPGLGSPQHAEVLCSASGFDDEYQLVIEDQLLGLPNQGGPHLPDHVRCDMVYFPIEGGGAVFSGSSIAYCGSLAWNGFDNDLATVTTRVLRSFCSELPEQRAKSCPPHAG